MLTGFNTDVAHDGITYHVQTEDKGLDTPIILSLVYVGGAILASKRTPYDDLLAGGCDEKALAERIQRQHKLICAAIRAGRIEDLKRMGARDATSAAPPASEEKQKAESKGSESLSAAKKTQTPALPLKSAPPAPPPNPTPVKTPAKKMLAPLAAPAPQSSATPAREKPATRQATPAAPASSAPTVRAVANGIADFARAQVSADSLYLILLDDEGDFRAGELVTIRAYVGRGAEGSEAIPNAPVSIKVLGTAFRPQIFSLVTDEQGIATARTQLPNFTSGRAAIMIHATAGGYEAELRRIIKPAKG